MIFSIVGSLVRKIGYNQRIVKAQQEANDLKNNPNKIVCSQNILKDYAVKDSSLARRKLFD